MLSESEKRRIEKKCRSQKFLSGGELCYLFAIKYSLGRNVKLDIEALQNFKFVPGNPLYHFCDPQKNDINKFLNDFGEYDLIIYVNKDSHTQSHFMSFCSHAVNEHYFVGTQSHYEKFGGNPTPLTYDSSVPYFGVSIVEPAIDAEHYDYVRIPKYNIEKFLIDNKILDDSCYCGCC